MNKIVVYTFTLAMATMAAFAQGQGAPAASGGPGGQGRGAGQGRGGGGGQGRGGAPDAGPPAKTTFVRLAGGSNAILLEPLALNDRSRIAVIFTHPEHVNNFGGNFISQNLLKYGYRVLLVNYMGREQLYYEFIPGLSAAVKTLRAVPGVEKVVLAGWSTGGAELSSFQDVAENGPKACQEPGRVYKCASNGLDNLGKADGLMLIESAAGAPERTDALNPAVAPHDWKVIHPELDMFSPANGYNPATRSATYSPEFLKKYFAAQAARSTDLINEAQARLAKIEKGEGDFKDDEPFVVTGSTVGINGARALLADTRLLSRTHAPHMLLKANGTKPVVTIPVVASPSASPDGNGNLYSNALLTTVKSYLSFQALRVSADYHMTEDNVVGVDWRSTPNSIEGNVQGIRVPTLIVSGTCASHVVYQEIAYDLSAAKDKEMIGVEGAVHGLTPCKPEYGDTTKRAFDYIDSWLTKPGRF